MNETTLKNAMYWYCRIDDDPSLYRIVDMVFPPLVERSIVYLGNPDSSRIPWKQTSPTHIWAIYKQRPE